MTFNIPSAISEGANAGVSMVGENSGGDRDRLTWQVYKDRNLSLVHG